MGLSEDQQGRAGFGLTLLDAVAGDVPIRGGAVVDAFPAARGIDDELAADDGGRSIPLGVRLALGVLVTAAVSYAVWLEWGPEGRTTWRDDVLYNGLLVFATTVIAARALLRNADRGAWAVLAVAMGFWTAGDIVYTLWISWMDPQPSPSVADWLWLSFYPLAYLGLILLAVSRVRHPPAAMWLDGLLAALAAAAFGWLAVSPIVAGTTGSPAALATNAAYPIADILLLCLLAGMMSVMRWHADRAWWLLAAGFALFAVFDTFYLLQVASETYQVGTVLDAGWLAAFVVIAFAAWQPSRGAGAAPIGVRALAAVPAAIVVAAFGLLIFATQRPIPLASVLLAGASVVVGGARAAQAIRQGSIETESRRLGRTDQLTGLGNRRLFNQVTDDVLAELAPGERCALLVINVDRFREVNASLGHAVGDQVLQAMAPRLAAGLPEDATLVRLGGDEFALLLSRRSAEAVAVAETIRRAMAQPFLLAGLQIQVDASIGIATCPDDADARESLLRCADAAMRRAKQDQTGLAVYQAQRDRLDRNGLLYIEQLRTAISDGQLFCVYQPKLNLTTGSADSVEALVRWRHPIQGVISPDNFLPHAERAGLMRPLTEAVLGVALEQAARWRDEQIPVVVAVNLSMTNLLDLGLPDTVARLLGRHGLPADAVLLEVTETIFMADPDRAQLVLGQLRDLGLRISIDDYGQAYSSLAQLRDLAAQELKLDKAFVTGLGQRADIRSIVRSTIEMAHDLGLRVVAEGAETREDVQQLRELGCDYAQGYYICPPLPPQGITSWLLEHNKAGSAQPDPVR